MELIVFSVCLILIISGFVIVLVAMKVLGSEIQRAYAQRPRHYQHHQSNHPSHPPRVEGELQTRLLSMVNGDQPTAIRLVNSLRSSNPQMPEDWYWEKAIEDLIRDRR